MCREADQNTVRSQAGNWLVGVGTSNCVWDPPQDGFVWPHLCVAGGFRRKSNIVRGEWDPCDGPSRTLTHCTCIERPSRTSARHRSCDTLKSRSVSCFFGIPAGPPRAATLARRDRKESVTQVYIYMSSFHTHTISEDRSDPSTTCTTMRFQPCFHQAQPLSSVSASQSQCHHASEFNQRVTSRPLAWMLPAPKDVALLRLRGCVSRGGGHISSRLLSAILLSHTSRSVSLFARFAKSIAPGTTTSADLPRSPVTHANSLPWQSTAHACCTCQSDALSLEPALNV